MSATALNTSDVVEALATDQMYSVMGIRQALRRRKQDDTARPRKPPDVRPPRTNHARLSCRLIRRRSTGFAPGHRSSFTQVAANDGRGRTAGLRPRKRVRG